MRITESETAKYLYEGQYDKLHYKIEEISSSIRQRDLSRERSFFNRRT